MSTFADLSGVSIFAATRERSLAETRSAVEVLVRDFEADPAAHRRLIREILDNERQRFYTSAIDILKTSGDSRGAQYLLALIVADGMLIDALCDPALSRDQAMALARAAVRVDPMSDAMSARKLADSAVGNGEPIADPARLIEILAEIADASRVAPHLMRLLRHPNPYLRSKVVKMIGRGGHSAKWVKARLNEPDPRVRANAMEAIWGVDTPEARALLQLATNDTNNRVLGNALLGLYYLGECAVLEELVRLSTHESALFRGTAAWVMGETGDLRFSDTVRHLLLETDAVVRKRALTALTRIKHANASLHESSQLHIAGRMLANTTLKGQRRILAAVTSDCSKEPPKLTPLQFTLIEGSQYVTSYRINERPEAEAFSVVWVIPRSTEPDSKPFADGALNCLKWRRPSDLWCVLPYLESADNGLAGQSQDMGALNFTANNTAIEALFQEPAKRIDCTDLWTAL